MHSTLGFNRCSGIGRVRASKLALVLGNYRFCLRHPPYAPHIISSSYVRLSLLKRARSNNSPCLTIRRNSIERQRTSLDSGDVRIISYSHLGILVVLREGN